MTLHRSPDARSRLHRVLGTATLAAVGVVGAIPLALSGAGPASAAALPDWTVYHGSAAGSGVDSSGVSFASPSTAWTSAALDGSTFGEPLEDAGRVFVATENDSVYALAADSGTVLWRVNLATPVPANKLGCGDVSPTVGITGTPVIDSALGEIFVVADEWNGSTAVHVLFGLNIYTGNVEMSQVAEPPGQDGRGVLQRTGLNLVDGRVVFGFGGNSGDCQSPAGYHGWVETVPETGGSATYYEVDPLAGQSQGAVWMGGAAPEVDAAGNIWFAAGNGSQNGGTYDFSDAVTKITVSSTSAHPADFFAPTYWGSDNASDADLGSSAPALLPNGAVYQQGKSQIAYTLDGAALGGISTPPQTAKGAICSGDVDGGDAVVGGSSGADTVYEPCLGGIEAASVTPGQVAVPLAGWDRSTPTGPPIVTGSYLWSIDQNGTLYELNSNGTTSRTFGIGASEANHFPTPSVGDGLLLAPGTNTSGDAVIYAFAGSAGLPGPPAAGAAPNQPTGPVGAGYFEVSSDGGLFNFGGAPFNGSMGGQRLNAPIVGIASTETGAGYWEVAADGGVFNFGDATFHGSMGGQHLNAPIVGIAAAPGGGGYWEVASDGGVFNFGDATFHGSMGGQHLNAPIVGIAAAPGGGGGYWEVASDGGVFSFGGAPFYGSMGGKHLNAPVVGITAVASGGYLEVASDGGVFAFGGAPFYGSMGGKHLNAPVVGIASTSGGAGYREVASDGGIFSYGTALFAGSMGGQHLNAPVVGIAIDGSPPA